MNQSIKLLFKTVDLVSVHQFAVHLAVAGDVFDGVSFCAVLVPTSCFSMKAGTELS